MPVEDGRRPTASARSDERGVFTVLDGLAADVDLDARRNAHRLVRDLQIEPPFVSSPRRGGPDVVRVRWDGRGGELDIDVTLDALMPGGPLREDQLIVRRRMTRSRAIVLLVDVSGSMKGDRTRTAAAAIGSLAGELSNDALGVTAFWSDAANVIQLGERRAPSEVLDMVLGVQARGLTNVGFGLTTAMAELDGWSADDARIILLSDCVHNAGPDPRPLALGGPRIDVLLDTSEENDRRVGEDLARVTGGRCEAVRSATDVSAALFRMFLG